MTRWSVLTTYLFVEFDPLYPGPLSVHRTHSGITDVANLIVRALVQYFPKSIEQHKDKAGNHEDETSTVAGLFPLLLGSLTTEDLCILLSGSPKIKAQVSCANMHMESGYACFNFNNWGLIGMICIEANQSGCLQVHPFILKVLVWWCCRCFCQHVCLDPKRRQRSSMQRKKQFLAVLDSYYIWT